MRFTLVDNLVLPAERKLYLLDRHPHLGLLSLAAVGAKHGHTMTVYDPKRRVHSGELAYDASLPEAVADEILAGAPDAVGFTTLGCSFLTVVGIGRALARRAPGLPLLLGGPHATMLARRILERYPVFDVVVRHEAEHTFPAVLAGLESFDFADIPGVTWRAGDDICATEGSPLVDDLDALPWLDYELAGDVGDLSLLRVEAGRGCPFACTFCSTAVFFQRKYRLKSPARLVAEMNRLRARYGPREFKLDHDLFTVDKKKVARFCDAVRGEGHRWRVSARADCVDEALLERMADAGCVGLYLGIEAGSPRMQKLSAKRLDLARVAPTLDICARVGIEATTSFITGYPREQIADQRATLDLVGTCFVRSAETCVPQLHLLAPEPGTPLFLQHREALRYDGYATPFNAHLLGGADDEAEVRAAPDIFATYHHYPAALPRARHIGVVQAVDQLRQLGRRIVTQLIAAHDHSLAALVDGLLSQSPRPGLADIESYVRAQLGDDDPLALAVRYAVLAAGGEDDAAAPAQSPPQSDAGAWSHPYCPAPGLRWLHDVPEVSRLLDLIEHNQDRERVRALPRASYVRVPGRSGPPLRVDATVAQLTGLFADGRTPREVCEALGAPLEGAGTWLSQLLEVGLLVPAERGGEVDA